MSSGGHSQFIDENFQGSGESPYDRKTMRRLELPGFARERLPLLDTQPGPARLVTKRRKPERWFQMA